MAAATFKARDDFTTVVAIDFGTTYSGYAFSFQPKERDIYMFSKWGECVGVPVAFKAPTCVLTKVTGEFEAFGYEAQQQYSELPPEEVHEYCLFDKFKMHLHKKKLSRKMDITCSSGHTRPAVDIFALVLRYLKGHLLQQIENKLGSAPSADHIQWVITVPAIWSNASRQFMREAAFKADLINDEISHQLLIALEPEAASMYCQDSYTEMSTEDGSIIVPGTQYLVLDCGGGTIDVTAHELKEKGKIIELFKATGGPLGGTQVDRNIMDLLTGIFGTPTMNHFQKESPGEYLQLCIKVERIKHVVHPLARKFRALSIPHQLALSCSEMTGKSLKESIRDDYKEKGVIVSSGMLRLPYDLIEGSIVPITDGIVSHVRKLLMKRSLRNIRHLLIVGGFGECHFLIHKLKKEFGPEFTFIIPDNASACVVKGAVLYGHNPSVIDTRRAPKTIGWNYNPPFDPSKHDPNRVILDGGNKHTKDAFFKVIAKGHPIQSGLKYQAKFAVTTGSSDITISLYYTNNRNPVYVDDEGINKLGDIAIQLPLESEVREIEMEVLFGGTEIEVMARDPNLGGKVVRTRINFLED